MNYTFKMANNNPRKMKQQQGLVLMVTLLALVIMLLASVALIRSTTTNVQIAGKMALKRDLINQAERAVVQIKNVFKTGALSNDADRLEKNEDINYYASVLPSNTNGLPLQLMQIANNNANNIIDTDSGVTIRYVIDRMCLADGDVTEQKCNLAGSDMPPQCDGDCAGRLPTFFPVYRISMRINGPNNSEAYLQTTYAE